MSPGFTPFDHWRRLLAHIEAGIVVNPADATWLMDGWHAATQGARLDVALGLARHGGAGGLSRMVKRDYRDGMLRELRRRFFLDEDARPAARAILALACRRRDARGAATSERDQLMDDILRKGLALPGEKRLAELLEIQEPLENRVLDFLQRGAKRDA
jgi:hypothetical protein